MNFGNIVGQTLDGKYKIEKQLGKGGMGAVYLSTHLGTERPVAVKVIVPEFMERAEFIERFRREARAAGRLRHPNVVDVTDFGIAETPFGKVAYLVMEYLDGCTLGEVLEEEKSLPVSWTIDILEQVCSAIGEAHQQGIIHRDLKPENIWLEPNQRGGYTVKVLDFGIAKLETLEKAETIKHLEESETPDRRVSGKTVFEQGGTSKKTLVGGGNAGWTLAGKLDQTAAHNPETVFEDGKATALFDAGTKILDNEAGARILNDEAGAQILGDEAGTQIMPEQTKVEKSEAGTLIQNQPADEEKKTAILPAEKEDAKSDFTGTRLMSPGDFSKLVNAKKEGTGITDPQNKTTQELTRVGAVLGTPLYMSPEQCRGEHLTPQSDIYSLAVIAYQMLGGKPPFEGNFTEVMEAHKSLPPPPLNAKHVPRRLKKIIEQALSKNPEDRPKDAESFATVLRAQSEGLGTLYRNAISIYGRFLPKLLLIFVLVTLPVTLLTIVPMLSRLLQYFEIAEGTVLGIISGVSWLLATLAGFFFGAVGFGMVTLVIARYLSAPLRPPDLRAAFRVVKRKWKTLLGLALLTYLLSGLGFFLCFFPGIYLMARFGFVTPAVVIENLHGRAALKRSNELFKRSPFSVIVLTMANFMLPAVLSVLIMVFIASVIGNIPSDNQFLRGMGARKTVETLIKEREERKAREGEQAQKAEDFKIEVGTGKAPNVTYGATNEDDAFSNDGEQEKLSEQDKFAYTAGQSLSQLLFQLVWFPLAVVISSFAQVLMALMYIKTRQAGGEPMRDLLKQFEDEDKPQRRWQKRIQQRLLQSGRVTGRT